MLTIDDLRGLSRPDQIKAAAKFAGVDPGVVDGIWATESQRGNPKWMQSPAGARGHFGLMPATVDAWSRRLNTTIDPNDFTQSLMTAAYQLRENMQTTKGDVGDALRMYNAGPDRSHWGNKETAQYVAKVTGAPWDERAAALAEHPEHGHSELGDNFTEFFYGSGVGGRGSSSTEKAPKPASFLNPQVRAVDDGFDASRAAQLAAENKDKAAKLAKDQVSPGDALAAGFRENSLFEAGARMIDRTADYRDPTFHTWLSGHLDDVYKQADTDKELHLLLSTGTHEEYDQALKQIKDQRSDQQDLSNSGHPLMYSLAGSVVDPINLGLGIATDGAFSAARLGGTTLLRSGRIFAGLGMKGIEGGIGGTLYTGLMDASGQHQGASDYLMNGGAGAALGLAHGLLGLPGAREQDAIDVAVRQSDVAGQAKAQELVRAAQKVGPEATPEQIVQRAGQDAAKPIMDTYQAAIAIQPDHMRLVPRLPEETPGLEARQAASQKYGGDLIADEGEGAYFPMMWAQQDAINKAIPTNEKGLTRVSGWMPGAESTAMTLLKSENEGAQALAKRLLENTTGAGGRTETAALSLATHERMLQQEMMHYHLLYDGFRQEAGRGRVSEHLDPQAYKEFNDRIFYEMEGRGRATYMPDESAWVRKAADMAQAGWQKALDLQKQYGTVGSNRLPETSEGYVPHRMSVEAVAKMNLDQKRAVVDVLSGQLQELNEFRVKAPEGEEFKPWDKEFTDKLARSVLERATNRQHGQFEIPLSLHEPGAADVVEDALKALDIDGHTKRELMGALSRGGAGYTKGRMKLDLTAPIPDGNGGTMKLGDLYDHDIMGLYRSYARRTAGEVALAQHGVMGTKGFKLLKQSIIARGGLTVKEMKALDQVEAEFFNMRLGDKRIPWMDNVSILTSAARLGGAAINQLGDYSNAVLALGIQRAMHAVGSLPRMFREVGMIAKGGQAKNAILRDFDHLGLVGMDDYLHTRMFDMRDYDVPMAGRSDIGLIGRAARAGAEAQYILTFHRRLVAMQTRGMSEQILGKMMHFIKHGKEDVALADMGLNASMREKLAANMDKIATFDSSGRLTGLDMHAGNLTPQDLLSLRQIIDRGSSQIIQKTFIGEHAPWAHDSLLSMLYKFRTYGITAMEKQWSRNTMNHGHALAFAALLGSISWALPIQMARVHMKTVGMSRSQAEKFKEQNMNFLALARSAANYAASAGIAPDLFDVGAGYGAIVGGERGKEIASKLGQSGRYGAKPLLGGTIAPGVGVIEDAWQATHGDVHKALKLLPGASAPPGQVLLNLVTPDPSKTN